jgi:release factor glutamine methyltransferase
MITIAELLRASGLAAVDARVLLRHVLDVSDVYLIAHANDAVDEPLAAKFRALAARRAAGEPVAYLVGEREFYGHVFKVTPAVLIPRPETELLVELALERLPHDKPARVLDLGTGSGCIAISIAAERHLATVTAADISIAALEIAQANARRLKLANITFVQGRWFEAVAGEQFDIIVSNPPYVAVGDSHLTRGDLRYEPAQALSAGDDGLLDIAFIVAHARQHLVPGGWLLLEHGYDQATPTSALLQLAEFVDVHVWRDLAGIERVSGGRAAL